jgi:hypothetical protein
MSIEDGAARVLDTDVRDVLVGPINGRIALGTAQVLRARNARAFRELEADATAAPVAAREFSRAERLLIRVPVYAADSPAVFTARLVSKPGKVMRDLPTTAAGPDRQQIDLPLAGLAAGDYLVELGLTSAAGNATDVLAFRVTP